MAANDGICCPESTMTFAQSLPDGWAIAARNWRDVPTSFLAAHRESARATDIRFRPGIARAAVAAMADSRAAAPIACAKPVANPSGEAELPV